MLRSASVFVVSIIILLAAFYLAERYLSPGFQACMEKHQAADANRTADDDITGRGISLVQNSIRCSGEFVETNSAAITALAAILVAAFTATLWIATGRCGKRFLYLWGWARYSDLLPNTPERITRFCWQIIADGNPLTFNPLFDPQGLRWSNIHQRRGNCGRR